MKIEADWLTDPATRKVFALLAEAGHVAHAVGGCVRNTILRVPVTDVDIATGAHPETVMALAEDAGIKAVPTGIEHGTVTLIVDGTPFEITTWRHDVETDGRRAVVAFATTLDEDAHRRDFTMNALYAAADGKVTDPVGGLHDLARRRVRFIGTAEHRIREDYLRILRFFRFHAWYGDPQGGLDPDALAAIAATVEGLDGLSAERVGAELLKLLAAPDPAPALAAMQAVGVLAHILPGCDATSVAPLVHLEDLHGVSPNALRRLAALGEVDPVALRMSRADGRLYQRIREAAVSAAAAAEIGYRQNADVAMDAILVRSALTGGPPPHGFPGQARHGAEQVFPISARDLMPALEGPALGTTLSRLEDDWIASDFALTRDDLLSRI